MRRLFVNADDFGLTDGITQGIVEVMERGIVGGTTAMVCAAGGLARLASAGAALRGRVGLHLQLTGGSPPCLPPEEVPSLVTAQGLFPRKKIEVADVNPDEVRREWQAQLARFREAGFEPSHLDSHHHIHKRPEVFPVFLELARGLGLPARAVSDEMRRAMDAAGVIHADLCVTRFYGENIDAAQFCSLVDAAFAALGGNGTVEVMVHPGHADAALRAISTYSDGRDQERRVLTDPELAATLADRDIVPIGPSSIARDSDIRGTRLSATS